MKTLSIRSLFTATALAVGVSLFLPASGGVVARELPDFVTLYEKNSPSVVSISVTTTVKRDRPRVGGANPGDGATPDREEMEEFFRRYFGGGGGGRAPREFRRQGGGSGFVISADGFIVTNAHVVEDADEVLVKFTDKRELKAKIIGSDKRTDVAIIKVEATGLPAVKIGSPDALKIGEWVAAIGQPLGFETTLTTGVVSAKARASRGGDQTGDLVPFIQHDAAVNPGNSGGPLFNSKGEVVAINSMIATVSGGFQGISFAIPIDLAMDVVGQLQAGGTVKRGMLGVQIGRVTRDLADAFGLPRAQGAVVSGVTADSAAAKAGIKEGDVILKFNDRVVEESSDLPRYVTAVRPGVVSKVQVWRDGKALDLNVTLGEFKVEPTVAAATERAQPKVAAKPETVAEPRLGLTFRALNDKERTATGLKTGGVVIASVEDKASAQSLAEGDVIVSVTRRGQSTAATAPKQFADVIKDADKGASLAFRVKRPANRAGTEYNEFFAPEKLPE
ncbi:MAG: Do family serine endopeptidase [Betaproteobacteria bacterium]|nr:MAG: Do family serine endopeptidase [Betaproteobacteria bacterium]